MDTPHYLENDQLRVGVKNQGAELTSIFSKRYQLEYLWQANPAFWAKQSPVLFPIVGTLRDNKYHLGEKTFSLPRHGFAREKNFKLEKASTSSLTFLLASDQETYVNYPYQFEFRIVYKLAASGISVNYSVYNQSDDLMYFSLGAHPAFNVPLEKSKTYEDYYLKFEKKEFAHRWPISNEGLILKAPESFFSGDNILPLTKSLFRNDALVFKDIASTALHLESADGRGIRMEFPGFPYFGIWAAKEADFVCLEPWCGIADPIDHSRQLYEKEGINLLKPKETFERTWTATFY